MHSPQIFISIWCHHPPKPDLSKMKHLFSPQLFHLTFLAFLKFNCSSHKIQNEGHYLNWSFTFISDHSFIELEFDSKWVLTESSSLRYAINSSHFITL